MAADHIAQCRSIVLQAAHCVDAGQYAELCEWFTPDAVLVRPNGAELRGREAIRQSYEAGHTELVKRHLVTQSVCLAQSADSLKLLSTVLLWKQLPLSSEASAGLPKAEQILGEFEDEFVSVAGRWLMRRRIARFLLRA